MSNDGVPTGETDNAEAKEAQQQEGNVANGAQDPSPQKDSQDNSASSGGASDTEGEVELTPDNDRSRTAPTPSSQA